MWNNKKNINSFALELGAMILDKNISNIPIIKGILSGIFIIVVELGLGLLFVFLFRSIDIVYAVLLSVWILSAGSILANLVRLFYSTFRVVKDKEYRNLLIGNALIDTFVQNSRNNKKE